ncbi:hypothetical protein VTI74DRAFT_4584 [Chaetomium olivicolor]
MDRSGITTPRSISSPRSPPAPLALSDFIAQATPSSETTRSEKPATSLEAPQLEVIGKPIPAPVQDRPRSRTSQDQTQESQTQLTAEEDTLPPVDWLATRQQLLPRRNQGKKADWIRGWSHAVSIHGDEAYCACSETLHITTISNTSNNHKSRKSKTSDLTSNVRAILQRTTNTTPSNNKPATPNPELSLCRNCSRPASPPASIAAGSVTSEKHGSQGSRSISKRFSELLLKVRPYRSRSAAAAMAHKRDAKSRNLAWPEEYQPKWATTGEGQKRLLVRPPSQPLSAPVGARQKWNPSSKSRSMDIFPGRPFLRKVGNGGVNGHQGCHGHGGGIGAESSGSDLDGLSDSDAPRHALSRSMSRLQRAAALLHRATSRPKD